MFFKHFSHLDTNKKMMTHARCRIIKFASNVASARKSMIDINEFRYF